MHTPLEPVTVRPHQLMKAPDGDIHAERSDCSIDGCRPLASTVDKLRVQSRRLDRIDGVLAVLLAKLEGHLEDLDAPAEAHDTLDALIKRIVDRYPGLG